MKGISPLISAVLLIAFTMAVAGIAGPFFTQLIQQNTQDNQDQADNLLDASKAGLEIESGTYSSTNGEVNITFQNTGSIAIENFTVSAFGEDPGQNVTTQTLEPKEITTVSVNTSSLPDSVRVESNSMPVSDTEDGDNILTGSAPAAPTGLSITS